MTNNNIKSYRIRTAVGDESPNVINVQLNQTFEQLEIMSIKINQKNAYRHYQSNYGVIVGRVIANGGFGIPNAKVSVFIPVDEMDDNDSKLLYNYSSTNTDVAKMASNSGNVPASEDVNADGIRYNLLPDTVDQACHQDVGSFPNKRLMLDNDNIIEIFDKYYKFTTTTNASGDYMLFGVPQGQHTVHVDVDLSDIGTLSQRPRDLIYKGYPMNLFESPNKFKQDTNLNSLSQIYTQDKAVFVYSYWGDSYETDETIAITRCDIQLDYKFEPTCIFMGSIITDQNNNAIKENCTGVDNLGKMSKLVTGEGSIEMIRKTPTNKVEEFSIKGNRLIDSDGVWCYQIPMNLDYVITDEFGKLVLTDDPDRGIPTRTRVRFRFTVDEQVNDGSARKRCRYLVPNNPRIDDEGFCEAGDADYEFGSMTRDESFCDMFWNNVYTVKNYVPRLQKNSRTTQRKHTGIKIVNHAESGINSVPYNSLTIKLSFTFRLICVLTKIVINLILVLNGIISTIGWLPCKIASIKILGWRPFKVLLKAIPSCIKLSSEFCDDGVNKNVYYPGCFDCVWKQKTRENCQKEQAKQPKKDQAICTTKTAQLYTCVENELAQQNEATSFNFYNDWLNGVLYMPMWYRKITPKRSFLFGLFKRKAKNQWCSSEKEFASQYLFLDCAVKMDNNTTTYKNIHGLDRTSYSMGNSDNNCGNKCHETKTTIDVTHGLIVEKETMLGQKVYYYRSCEMDGTTSVVNEVTTPKGVVKFGAIKTLFATDIVLLGSLNDCDRLGTPQFFKSLDATTYNMPYDILFTDMDVTYELDANGDIKEASYTLETQASGCDWGNKNEYGKDDGGLFYGIGCSTIEMRNKSCINLRRMCELGVSEDVTFDVTTGSSGNDVTTQRIIADGYVSFDELYDTDARAMFATMNGNRLRTKLNTETGLYDYDFRYLYPVAFDGSLAQNMATKFNGYPNSISYRDNAKYEKHNTDYFQFRMGENPYFYDKEKRFPRYDNSFYFYFGLNQGKTAIEKFNSQFFATCESVEGEELSVKISAKGTDWCNELANIINGYIKLDLTGISTPYSVLINGLSDSSKSYTYEDVESEKIYIGKTPTPFDESFATLDAELTNGDYEIAITDNDGNISTYHVNLSVPYLTYRVDTIDFKQPNNVYDGVGTDGVITAPTDNTEYESYVRTYKNTDIGGLLFIHDIMNNNEYVKMGNDYSIEVVNVDTGVTVACKETRANNLNPNSEIYVYALPKGDCEYRVIVTQKCNGVVSKNTVEIKKYVSNPSPYRLLINDFDYAYMSGWQTGWQNGNASIGDRKVVGWIAMSDIASYNWDKVVEYENIRITDTVSQERVSYANLVKIINTAYPNKGNYINHDASELITIEGVNCTYGDVQELIELVENTIAAAKTAFYITCPNENQTLSIQVITQDYPITYDIKGHEEAVIEDDEDENHEIKGDLITDGNTSSVDDIAIPNITSIENQVYGNDTMKINGSNTICYGYDKVNKKAKSPYWVKVSNEAGQTLPENGSYFGVMFIDKILQANMLAWSYFKDIPQFKPIPDGKIPVQNEPRINMSGILAGKLINGVVQGKDHQFSTQMVGIVPMSIVTYKGTDTNYQSIWEDEIPTTRFINDSTTLVVKTVVSLLWEKIEQQSIKNAVDKIVSEYGIDVPEELQNIINAADDEWENIKAGLTEEKKEEIANQVANAVADVLNNIDFYPYKSVVSGLTNYNKQYQSLLELNANLTLSDENGCGVNDTVYGKMKLKISDDSINDCHNGNKIFKLNMTDGDNRNSCYYYACRGGNNGEKYPLHNTKQIANGLFWNCENKDRELLSYDYLNFHDTIMDTANSKVEIADTLKSTINIDGNDTTTNGYGTTGIFGMGDDLNKPIYGVVNTANNCRALSPLYYYGDMDVKIKTSSAGDTHYVEFIIYENKLASNLNYYMQRYEFTAEVSIDLNAGRVNQQQTIYILPNLYTLLNKFEDIDISKVKSGDGYCVYDTILQQYTTRDYIFDVLDERGQVEDSLLVTYASSFVEGTTNVVYEINGKLYYQKSGASDVSIVDYEKDKTWVNPDTTAKTIKFIINGEEEFGGSNVIYIKYDKTKQIKKFVDGDEIKTEESDIEVEASENNDGNYVHNLYFYKSTSALLGYVTWGVLKYCIYNEGTTMDDPTKTHYQRNIRFNISSGQRAEIETGMALGLIKNKAYLFITDASGLKHSCKIV